MLPLGYLTFQSADKMALCTMAMLIPLTIGWLRARWNGTTIAYTVLAFASYPVIVSLQMRQPTILFFGLILASLALLRSDRLLLAGLMAALACGKPQIALPVLLPMLIWTLEEWRERKRFVAALTISQLTLLAASDVLSPGWISEWLASVHGYSRYVDPSIVVSLFGVRSGSVVSSVLVLLLMAALWLHRDRDLAFQAALSVGIFSMLIQSEIYNALILIVPAVWVADNIDRIQNSGTANQLILAIVRVSFIEFWLAAPIGAVLIHTTPLGVSLAWWLSVNMVFPLIVTLAAIMIAQLFASQANTVAAGAKAAQD